MTPPRRAKLVLLVLACAIVGLGVWRGAAVWWWATTKRVYEEWFNEQEFGGHPVRGWKIMRRWGGESAVARIGFYAETGMKAIHEVYEPSRRITVWNIDGTVRRQGTLRRALGDLGGRTSEAPPWQWGVTDRKRRDKPAWSSG